MKEEKWVPSLCHGKCSWMFSEGGPLKATTEAALIICKIQREEPLNSYNTARKSHARLHQGQSRLFSLHLLQPQRQWAGWGREDKRPVRKRRQKLHTPVVPCHRLPISSRGRRGKTFHFRIKFHVFKLLNLNEPVNIPDESTFCGRDWPEAYCYVSDQNK